MNLMDLWDCSYLYKQTPMGGWENGFEQYYFFNSENVKCFILE